MLFCGLWCIYAGNVGIGLAYLGICVLCIGDANTQEELEYLRNEIKTLQEQQHR